MENKVNLKDENLKRIKELIESNIVFQRKSNIIKERNRLETYYNIGREIVEAIGIRSEYGKSLLKEYSKELTTLYGKGYNYTNLKNMRQLYLTFKKSRTMCDLLSWSHYRYILPIKEESKRNYYINLCIQNRLTVRKLIEEIKSKSYERLISPNKNNIKLLKESYEPKIIDMIKDPIIIECDKLIIEKIDERVLKEILLENIEKTLLNLGVGFSFVGSEQRIKVGNNYRFIDLVFFNIELNCFVLIELKIKKLDIRDIGQLEFYINYYDTEIRKPYHNKTIGIIICKKNDKGILKYNKKDNILVTTYKLSKKQLVNN
ncbi:MAG: DUF1016 family protein [Bacilli bacterium]|nr:DUF1016 family protein [Bacilli bacterium]